MLAPASAGRDRVTALLVAGVAVAYLTLLLVIGSLVGRLLAYATRGYEALEPVRCSCRRHSFPSPLCLIHGKKAA